ncbi:hypothetical protein ABT56_18985 [Photobacterium aquae]|uniref:DGQHR domain-containing protein n=1 Tax=Photobacterium aquae TaxID=1195763 RepID=A0A0J1GUU9_9GAMM|nr:DGQHR domain-containing protein [Photobacterium aquae]KLV03520.1 hypothetical protein ABT56_18985 [Photobacterium aquae]
MTALKDFNLQPITSIENIDLLLFPSRNGLGDVHNFDVFYGEISLCNLDKHFDVEANSDTIDESLKMQRDVDTARVKALTSYLKERKDYALPPVIFFVNRLSNVVEHSFNAGKMVEATLEATSHRFIVDGQGRTYTIKTMIKVLKALKEHGLGFMMFVTNTDSIYDAEVVIKQLFSDINGKTKKPSTSLSLYFDSSKPFSRLLNEIIQAEITIGSETKLLSDILSKQGNISVGKLWTYKQFSKFFCTVFNESEASLNKSLADPDTYCQFVDIGKKFVLNILNNLPVELLFGQDWRKFHEEALFTKALFANGVALVGLSLIEQSAYSGSIEWSKLDRMSELPIVDMSNDLWVKYGVCSNENGKVKIIRGCDKKIARVLCNQLNIMPSMEI